MDRDLATLIAQQADQALSAARGIGVKGDAIVTTTVATQDRSTVDSHIGTPVVRPVDHALRGASRREAAGIAIGNV